ncbi:DUF6036 family nucleotidyltransferase [Planococcus alpniumensis]|uniref:DUF6036 family nucleotidyltransferase n=1 Tax=Planococcus alpniumensis TaxID=2708345 RepID=UPI001B8AE9F1|nr:DUF6036 family nucleotidyltransferase [Planococcus sp. MSAK28401]
MVEMNYEDVIMELAVLDAVCESEEVELEIAIFGGAALLFHLGDAEFRGTRDIDFRVEKLNSREKLKTILDKTSGVFQLLSVFPEWPDQEVYLQHGTRYHEMDGVAFTNLRIFLPSIEMLALSKLISKREKDLEDLKTKPIMEKCDLALLSQFVEEGESFFFNTSEFNFHEWDDILASRGIDWKRE